MLHHSQEQAFRPVPRRTFVVGSRGWASCPPAKGFHTNGAIFQLLPIPTERSPQIPLT
ncbi:hypothetical protein QUB16_28125 [Microcoleus sp. D3_18a_C4]